MESKTSSLVADSIEGSSSESDQKENENENEGYSTPPGSTITDQKMMMTKKKKMAIPNPASAAADSKAANPKRFREEKVDINESENVSSKRKKAKADLSITSPVVVDVSKSSSTGITWTENEEMAILGGLISFKAENRKYKLKEFYSCIKDRLGQGDSIQVQDKVKSLKRKYIKMRARNQMSFANSHEHKVFILSKIYWGDVKNGETKNTIIDDGDKLKEVKTLVVHQQPEQNSLVLVQQQAEEDSLVVEQQPEEHSLVVQKKNPNEKNDDDHDHDLQKNPKEKIDQILLDGLGHYLETELFDGRWLDDDQLRNLETKWKKLQVSRANYKSAKSQFKAMVYQLAVQGYNMNMM